MLANIDDCRQPRRERKREDACAVGGHKPVNRDVQGFGLALERLEDGRNVLRTPYFQFGDLYAEFCGCGLNLAQLQHGFGIVNVGQYGQTAKAGQSLA